MCADQGVEKGIADVPNVENPEQIQQILTQVRTGQRQMLATKPDSYFFPVLLLITGPMHILWNSFETAIKMTKGWQSYKPFLAAVLSVLGNRGQRERYMNQCVPAGAMTPAERKELYNWPYKLIEWNWHYMEEF